MVLLDTHVLIWMMFDDHQISKKALQAIETNDCCISIATIWEIAIKTSLGKLKLPKTLPEIAEKCADMGIDIVGISLEDCLCVQDLPLLHRDPFDRIIISHAVAEHIPLITHDMNIHRYGMVNCIW